MQALRLQNTPGQALEHEMGELFKVLGFCVGQPWRARGFATGDRLHEL